MVPPFTGKPGFQFDITVKENISPLGIFNNFIGRDMIKFYKKETNKYAQSVMTEKEKRGVPLSKRSILKKVDHSHNRRAVQISCDPFKHRLGQEEHVQGLLVPRSNSEDQLCTKDHDKMYISVHSVFLSFE